MTTMHVNLESSDPKFLLQFIIINKRSDCPKQNGMIIKLFLLNRISIIHRSRMTEIRDSLVPWRKYKLFSALYRKEQTVMKANLQNISIY